MNETRTRIARALDEAVPRSHSTGDWARVVRDASGGRRLRWLPRAGLATAALAAVAAFALAAPFGSDSGGLRLDRALAAFGTGPVVHAVIEHPSGSVVVDLETGRERSLMQATEYWWDEERRTLRVRLTIDGAFLTDLVESPEGSWSDLGDWGGNPEAELDPALAGFADRYRAALRDGTAREVSRETIDGRDLVILRIARGGGQGSQEVAVDAEDYRPRMLRWRRPDESVGTWTAVTLIETLPRNPALFAPPERSEPRPMTQASLRERRLTRAEAATSLDGRALWAGAEIDGVDLAQIHLTNVKLGWRDKAATQGQGLELVYGNPRARRDGSEPWLVLVEARSAAEAGFSGAMGGPPVPAEGDLHLKGGDVFWWGELQRNGVFVAVRGRSRELVIEAAKALRPIG
jgi:hypothetical protein